MAKPVLTTSQREAQIRGAIGRMTGELVQSGMSPDQAKAKAIEQAVQYDRKNK